jgi:nitrate reductase beta subunit
MSSALHADLSSLVDTVDGLRRRVASLAEPLTGGETEELMVVLHEAERSLLMARRHLDRATRLSR